PFLNLEQIYVLDFSQFDFEYAIIYVSAKGQSLYKCPTWNFTTRTCVNEGSNWGTPTPGVKTEKEGNGTSGWLEWVDIPDDESIYSFYMYPGDPGFIEDGANYCSESPCIATSDMICSVDNAGGIAEFNQPNTLDNCRDGQKGTYLTDESVENITITDQNGSVFMVGDTVNVKATVHCWHDGSEDNINIVYSNNTGGVPQSWRVIDYVDPCPAGGMNEISLNFTLDNRTGNHSIRVINQHNGAVTATCGNGNYDDNDDLSFEVFCHDENETEPPGILKMEWDTVTAGESWEIVNLSNTYVSPVIVVSNQYANNNLPFVPRISNVTNNSFIIKIQNPGQSPVAPETLHYLVVEEGNWTLPDGTPIEARKYLSTVVGSSSNWIGESQSHNNIYSNPIVVFASLMSYNDPGWQTVTP
ncbi:MAG: hypothetical protein KAS15_05550, partial [Nanoarchaeota archaeon]|nr:hypothetical protein [Nanoarchaeota archaeon]